MTTPDEFDFNYGAEGAAEAFANLKSGGFRGIPYLSMKNNETAIMRFLNDAFRIETKPERVAWITIDQHSMVPTKPAPQGYQGKWPQVMGAVCRHAKAFRDKFPDCYICDGPLRKSDGKKYDPSPRTWSLACLREEVVENGQVIGIRDKTVEVPKFQDGKQVGTEMVKAIVIVNLGYKNFFSIMEGFAGRYETVLDRDFHVKRVGTDTNTIYQIAPLDKIPVDDNGRIYDLRDDEFYNRYAIGEGADAKVPDLRKIVAERASDDYYGRFFDPRVSNAQPDQSGNGQQQAQQQPAGATAAPPQGGDVDEARLASLRDRVKGTPGGDAAPAATEQPAAAPAAGGMRAL